MEETTTNDAARGIHVTLLHQSTGAKMATGIFDTYMSKEESTSLVHFLNMVSDGRILCFAIKVSLPNELTYKDSLSYEIVQFFPCFKFYFYSS